MYKYNGINFVLVRRDGKVLMQLRDSGTRKCPNQWCFPGGAIESMETLLDALLREIEEETHLKLKAEQCESVADFHYLQENQAKVNRFFICYVNGSAFTNGEGTLHWLTWEEILELDLALGEKKMIDILRNEINKREG